MPIELALETPARQEIYDLLNRIQTRLGNLTPAMNVIGEIVHGSIQQNFEQGGRPPWKDLSETTKAQRRRIKKWPGQILVRSGVAGGLMGSISYKAFADRVELRANKIYAAVQHFGAKKGDFGTVEAKIPEHERTITQAFGKPIAPMKVRIKAHLRKMILPWGDIPARSFMMVQDEDWQEIRESMLDMLLA